MNNRLNNFLSLVQESARAQQINENFGKLSPLMQRIGPLAKAFRLALKSGGSLGQNSEFETTEKITYANLLRLLNGDIKLSNGSNLNGAVVMINGKPALSLAYGQILGRHGRHAHSAIYLGYDRNMFIDAVYGDINLPEAGSIPSDKILDACFALDAYNNTAHADMMHTQGPIKVTQSTSRNPIVVHSPVGNFEVKVQTYQTASSDGVGQKRVVSFIQNMIKLHSKLAEALDPSHKVKFSIIGIGADADRVAAAADRQVAKAGVVPLPSDKSYKEYINRLSIQLKKSVEKFRIDKLTPTLKKMSMGEFNDSEALTNAIKNSKIFEQELLKIGPFTYKLEKLEANRLGMFHSGGPAAVPQGTIVQALEFKYRIVDSDRKLRDDMADDWKQKAKGAYGSPMSDDAEVERYQADRAANVPPTEYSGEAHIFINLLNLADTRIEVKKVTSYNW